MYTYYIHSIDRVVDGDTVDVTIDLGFGLLKKERIRLYGVDTPESRTTDKEEKKYGLEAADYLGELLHSTEEVVLETLEKDKYGRWLGKFYVDGTDLPTVNEILVEEGYGWDYFESSRDLHILDARRQGNTK